MYIGLGKLCQVCRVVVIAVGQTDRDRQGSDLTDVRGQVSCAHTGVQAQGTLGADQHESAHHLLVDCVNPVVQLLDCGRK